MGVWFLLGGGPQHPRGHQGSWRQVAALLQGSAHCPPTGGNTGLGLAPSKPIWFSSLARVHGAVPAPAQPKSFQDALHTELGPPTADSWVLWALSDL